MKSQSHYRLCSTSYTGIFYVSKGKNTFLNWKISYIILGERCKSICLPSTHEMKYLKREKINRTNSKERQGGGRGGMGGGCRVWREQVPNRGLNLHKICPETLGTEREDWF